MLHFFAKPHKICFIFRKTPEVPSTGMAIAETIHRCYTARCQWLHFFCESLCSLCLCGSKKINHKTTKTQSAQRRHEGEKANYRRAAVYEVEIVKSDAVESMVKVTFLPEKRLPGEWKAILELKTSSERQPVFHVTLTCEDSL